MFTKPKGDIFGIPTLLHKNNKDDNNNIHKSEADNQKTNINKYRVSPQLLLNYRVATLPTLYLIVLEITIPSLKLIGQF